MGDLKQLYRQAVVSRVSEIEAALAAIHERDAESETTLRRVAHSLRGSGGTYGFPEVSAAAGAVEDAETEDIADHARELLNVLHGVIAGGPRAARVLIIDDDPEILLLLTTVLTAPGRELHTADSGAAAAQQLANGGFALMILDLLLPDIDGTVILKNIRADARFTHTPVIVLSARTTAETRRVCEEFGATAFFEKPFDPEAVAAAVSAQLLRVADSETDAPA